MEAEHARQHAETAVDLARDFGELTHHFWICSWSVVASRSPLRVRGFFAKLHGKTGRPFAAHSRA